MLNILLAFIGRDPVLVLLLVGALSFLLAAIMRLVLQRWIAHEELKAQDLTRRYMQATLPSEWEGR